TGRLPGRHRGEHALATPEQVPAAPVSSGARYHLRLQQVPAHGPQHFGKTPGLPGVRAAGDPMAAGVRAGAGSAGAEFVEVRTTTKAQWEQRFTKRSFLVLPLCPLCLCGTRARMTLIPHRFLFRVAHPCRHIPKLPKENDDRLLDLPEACRVDNFAE